MHPQIQFHNFSQFIDMGKHGIYVWACWGIVFAIIFGLVIYSVQQRTRLITQIKQNYIKKPQI